MPLYALGSNSCHQLSLGHVNDVSTPSLTTLNLPPNEHPIKIVAGSNHTLLLTNTGTLYVTGANKYGQCLKPACDVVSGFVQVDGRWRDCAATWEGSIVVDENGLIWSCGRIKNHENLNGVSIEDESVTRRNIGKITGDEGMNRSKGNKSIHVTGGVQHFIAFGERGTYGYGDERKGRFGNTSHSETGSFKLSTANVIQATCGKDFTCLLSEDDKITLYTTSSKHNLLSIPTITNIKSVTSSWSTIALLHNSGQITSWGRSDRGQLPPSNLPAISRLSAGSEHFIALSQNQKVYTWGWNEHGNCGLSTLEDVTFVHEIPFAKEEIPMYVAAGCGSSWIWTGARST
jgi:protein ATS1